MNIIFFSHYFPPEGNAPASRTYDHAVRWVEKGAKITVITCAPNVAKGSVYAGYENPIWPKREMMDGIEVIRVWTWITPRAGIVSRTLNFVSYLFSALFAFIFLCKRPDLIMATSPQFFCGWAGTIASWLKWRPFLLEVRDLWPESMIAVGVVKENSLAVRILRTLEKWMYRSAKHIVTVGPGYRDGILKTCPELVNDISVITNGVDQERFSPDLKFDGPPWPFENKFVCAYVGTIGMSHGLETVLDAAEDLKRRGREDICFCLVGDGASRARLEQESKDRDLEDFVYFTGHLEKSLMPCVLHHADALLVHLVPIPLFETVIPSKIFEALAMEKPLIMGVNGDAKRIVDAAGAGLEMQPGDPTDLARLVVRMSEDEAFREQFTRNGRHYVESHFSRDSLASQYLDIIQSVGSGMPVDSIETLIPTPAPAPVPETITPVGVHFSGKAMAVGRNG